MLQDRCLPALPQPKARAFSHMEIKLLPASAPPMFCLCGQPYCLLPGLSSTPASSWDSEETARQPQGSLRAILGGVRRNCWESGFFGVFSTSLNCRITAFWSYKRLEWSDNFMYLLIFRILRPCVCSFGDSQKGYGINKGISVAGCLERKSHSQDCHMMGRQ